VGQLWLELKQVVYLQRVKKSEDTCYTSAFLSDFLPIKASKQLSNIEIMPVPHSYVDLGDNDDSIKVLPQSKKTTLLFKALNSTYLSQSFPVKVLQSSAGDSFDCALAVLDTKKQVHLIFIDFKSKYPTGTYSTDPITHINDFPSKAKQYQVMRKRLSSTGNMTAADGSLLSAVVAGRWKYVYMQPGMRYNSFSIEKDKLLYMGDKDCQEFLGVFYNMYVAVRSSFGSDDSMGWMN
jgi:hypothetical protein